MALKRVVTDDKNLQLIQDNVQSSFNDLSNCSMLTVTFESGKQVVRSSFIQTPFVNGTVVSCDLTSGQDNLVPHGLKRVPTYWYVIRLKSSDSSGSYVWEYDTAQLKNSSNVNQSANETYLNLRCLHGCTVSIWVS